jgi:hypothetical protein
VKLGFRTRPVSVIRKGDWKLHLFHEEWTLDGGRESVPGNGAVEIYQIKNDPGEHNNLAHIEEDRRNQMLDDLLGWLRDTKAPMPTAANPSYDSKEQPEKPLRKKPNQR